MWEWLGGQLPLLRRSKKPMGCLMIDIDHFKPINDELGHDVGDDVIKEFSELVTSHLRASDILVRYGGEEFVALLPECEQTEAVVVGRRVCSAAAAASIAALAPGRVTCSVGVACWVELRMATGAELLREADKQLYRAKNSGRNRVCPA
jgi:diguanylate cyclase (GGDEF)-like protein